MSPLDVLSVMQDGIADYTESGHEGLASDMTEAHNAVAQLIDCVGDAQTLLTEIDKAVRAEHAKNGAPQSKSVAGIINARLTAALARVTGGAA